MVTRNRIKARQNARLARARRHIRAQGWSGERAATFLEISKTHLYEVLRGRRESESLLARIFDLPKSPVRYRLSGFALKSIAA